MLLVGDSVVLAAHDRVAMTSRWDPHWEITRVSGPVVYVRNQLTGKHKPVNREKVRLVDTTVSWDEINPRPRRRIRRGRRGQGLAQPENQTQPEFLPPPPALGQPGGAETTNTGGGTRESDAGEGDSEDNHRPHSVFTNETPPPPPMPEANRPQPPHPSRPQRQSRLSARALAAASQSDDDLVADPVVAHFRKRAQGGVGPSPSQAKKARIAVVGYLRQFLKSEHTHTQAQLLNKQGHSRE